MNPVRLAEVIAALDAAYPPALAEAWDSVGLVCGDPGDVVSTVMVAVDPTAAVVDEAIGAGADLLLVHHPLLLRGVDTVGAHTPKGALVHKLIKAGCALFTAHTNADSADPGVSDALAEALGLTVTGPIEAQPTEDLDKWVVLVPAGDADTVRRALFDAGAGQIGNYRDCSWSVTGHGQFLPIDGANPTLGAVGALERVEESRVEVIAPRRIRQRVLAAMRAAHPYEEVAFDVFETATFPGPRGLGRVGELPEPLSLRDFTDRVADALPATTWGVRAAGDPDATIRTVAVCGGSGDSFLDVVSRLGVDAYVTADLRHHPADEHLRAGGPALIDVAHWASEQPWCAQAKGVLDTAFAQTPEWQVSVSAVRTDPWSVSASSS
ncbi:MULTISPECIES: Nif3-like dinuclear metal center hexameric protein [unclassified Rhodococcus (in: high G+C Gram-positive bacteria)]|uniref:Nif3-like dinuclear metal center hexameric protein n=1 Tax=unclassified Rhodococcus (in: high G+C Gram-positive bacteria) TaxID=192944 RepID=UPI001639FBCC|nr:MULTISPECIES: Nif3-like dinuclear metal center hexameric protein [unclassified Rhodococcus (in: high G+C Gram-positive bacteria)]MBC2638638.1 Nif3-like dinuclear metal center hexameric protein [Rhodococcus sp. 3A]MBC2896621.1 Nif3-like dinuclear metal center hexameric protein [Rhodococcus sp. 4CII]